MHEIQIAGRECFVGPGVTYFRFERVELVRVGKVELVFRTVVPGSQKSSATASYIPGYALR